MSDAPASAALPVITLSDAARAALREALGASAEDAVHLAIDARFEHDLYLGPREAGELAVDASGMTVLLDPESARRADGVVIDLVAHGGGQGFAITNPNEPPRVRQLAPAELRSMLDGGAGLVLVDVRTESERAIARIEGSRRLDPDTLEDLLALDRGTPLVFQCHHGIRSQAAAERFLREGFRRVYNLAGGIDAWSRAVDPAVPRY